MPRGGKRTPAKPAPVSGPGAFSKRTDGKQPIRSEGLDNPDVQYGDVGKIRAGQAAAPLPQGVVPPRPTGARPQAASPRTRGQGGIPLELFSLPSARPAEPPTTGLGLGPGAGPEALDAPLTDDPREEVLIYMSEVFGSEVARDHLAQLRAERAERQTAPSITSSAPTPKMVLDNSPVPEETEELPAL